MEISCVHIFVLILLKSEVDANGVGRNLDINVSNRCGISSTDDWSLIANNIFRYFCLCYLCYLTYYGLAIITHI